jgi:hypothetical protein
MDKYYMYKHIFSGVFAIDDIIFLKNKCPVEDWGMIDSILKISNIPTYFSCAYMNEIIKNMANLQFQDDCEKYLSELQTKTATNNVKCSNIQQETFTKIMSTKMRSGTYIELPKLEKRCPHCGRINSATIGTSYIVCGIDSRGIIPIDYSNNACLKDWCFTCGKKLCKSWYTDELYIKENRKHDGECCKIQSKKIGNKYLDDYCQCSRLELSHS